MSEVIRYLASYFPHEGLDLNGQCARHDGEEFVHASDFDRVTAERDALQALLTAADERLDQAVTALNEIARVSRMGEKPFEIATLAIGEMSALKPAKMLPADHKCIECESEYCHGVCVERGDSDDRLIG